MDELMVRKKNKPTCLSCTHYRPTGVTVGRCRLDRGKIDPSVYPVMAHEDCCESWQDAGQNYHIRVGWIRGLACRATDDSGTDDLGAE